MVVIIMGVAGCGKSSLGSRLAAELKCPFVEGDSFHPPTNVNKMKVGIPLSDSDRFTWLEALCEAIAQAEKAQSPVIASCSALKQSFRLFTKERLKSDVRFIYLRITLEESLARVESRHDHFMSASLVSSQFQILEEPTADEAFIADATNPIKNLAAESAAAINTWIETLR